MPSQVHRPLLVGAAYDDFDGTGYLLFSGVTKLGDWAAAIAGLRAHWLWRVLLVFMGAASYYAAAVAVGISVRYVEVRRDDSRRLRKLLFVPYLTAVLACERG